METKPLNRLNPFVLFVAFVIQFPLCFNPASR